MDSDFPDWVYYMHEPSMMSLLHHSISSQRSTTSTRVGSYPASFMGHWLQKMWERSSKCSGLLHWWLPLCVWWVAAAWMLTMLL